MALGQKKVGKRRRWDLETRTYGGGGGKYTQIVIFSHLGKMMSKGGLLERKEEEGKRSVFLMVFFSFVEIPSIIKRKRKSPLLLRFVIFSFFPEGGKIEEAFFPFLPPSRNSEQQEQGDWKYEQFGIWRRREEDPPHGVVGGGKRERLYSFFPPRFAPMLLSPLLL